MAIADLDNKSTDSPFELISKLETIFNGAFVKTEEGRAVDENNYFTASVRTVAGSKTVCFRKEVLSLPIIKQVLGGGGRGRPKGSLNKVTLNGVKKKPRIFSTWLECRQCEYKCRKRKPLQNHMLEEHNEIIYLCEHCDDIFKDKSEMQEHERTVHGGIKYPCPELDCTFATSDVRELEEHVDIHQDFVIPCELCEFKAQSIRKLNSHMCEKHEGCKVYCSFCEFHTGKPEILKSHEDLMHKQNIASCSRCDFTTCNAKLLNAHEETFHKTIEYKCSQCNFKCNWESSLRQHGEQCHGSKEFSCEQCDFKCKWKTGFNKHMREKHSESGNNTQCSFCGVEFPCRRDLKKHIKENHEIPQEFNCSYCGKNFPKKPNLKIHERIHTGEKPYKCETCGHAFTAASNLYHHKKKHSKESCAAKAAVKQESGKAGLSVQGIYEQQWQTSSSYRGGETEVGLGEQHPAPAPVPHLPHMTDSPGETGEVEPQYGELAGSAAYLSNFSQYYCGSGHQPTTAFPEYSESGAGDSWRGRGGGGPDSYRRYLTEEQYRMFAQEEDYRKRSIEQQYRKFVSEEHCRALASEEQYRRLASLASHARTDKPGPLWMPALH